MLGYALDRRWWPEAEYVVRALDAYWDARGLGGEADAWADRILATTCEPGQAPPDSARSLWLYTIMAQADRQRAAGQLDQAARVYRRALAYLQDQPATEWTRGSSATLYHQLGWTAQDRGRLDEAEGWYRPSLGTFEELGNRRSMAITYHHLGSTALLRGQMNEAEGWYRKSLAIKEELGDRHGMAITYHQLGVTDQSRGQLDEADEWYRRSLAIKEELGDRPGLASTYSQLGNTAQARERPDEADEWYRKSLAISEEFVNRPYMAITYHQLGNTALSAVGWTRPTRGPGSRSRSPRNSATIPAWPPRITSSARRRCCARMDEVEEWTRRAAAIEQELGDRSGMAKSYARLGLLAEARAEAARHWSGTSTACPFSTVHLLTASGPSALARLGRQLGLPTLEQTWQTNHGRPLPQPVRDYVTSVHDQDLNRPGDHRRHRECQR